MKIKYILPLLPLALVGCSDLNLNESVYHTKEYEFGNFPEVKQVMTNVYGYLQSGFNNFQECASDDAVYANSPDVCLSYYDGSWSSNKTVDDQWNYYYRAIRAANYLLENCPEDFPEAKWDENYKYFVEQLKNYPWEARALRAYFHMELLKRYGNIPLATKTLSPEQANALEPSTYEQAVEWISSELKECSEHLPSTYSGTYYSEVGRVTRGFALAARARLLLYAASPLHNEENDPDKYKAAAAAALEFIDSKSEKAVYTLIKQGFNVECSDLIFGIRENTGSSYESNNFPVGYEGGNGGMCPSLNLVEAFAMTDGSAFDRAKDSDQILNPASRDPRLSRDILTCGDIFKGLPVESFDGGANGYPKVGASPTSFYLRKFIQESTSLQSGNYVAYSHIYPIFRVEEVYLNYAEALFEATGDPEFGGVLAGVRYSLSPRAALNKIRALYGVPGIKTGLSTEEFRTLVRNERRVELCFEGHRFWDIRRWKIGPETKDVYGLKIVKNPDESLSYEKVLVQSRYWDDKMYLYPISQVEMHKNLNLRQNLGW